jgi:GT2 family glycosyltransferase
MKFSLVVLTYNRAKTVRESMEHNLSNAGRMIDEIIHVDNGSTDDVCQVMQEFKPDVTILNKTNLGVAKGYNRGVVLATGSHIVINGCDRKMPDNWLATYEKYFETIPSTGVISCYSQPMDKISERNRSSDGKQETMNGLEIHRAMPMGAKCFPRELLRDVGHLREDFGLYGHEDVEWGYRFERVCQEKWLMSYIIPGFQAEHMGSEGIKEYNGIDKPDYHAFKQTEATDPAKEELMTKCRNEGFLYYTPYV